MTLAEMMDAARRHDTRMADAMLVACVDADVRREIALRETDVIRYVEHRTRDPYLMP